MINAHNFVECFNKAPIGAYVNSGDGGGHAGGEEEEFADAILKLPNIVLLFRKKAIVVDGITSRTAAAVS